MTSILSRVMTEAHAERVILVFCFLSTLCVFVFLMIVTFLGDS